MQRQIVISRVACLTAALVALPLALSAQTAPRSAVPGARLDAPDLPQTGTAPELATPRSAVPPTGPSAIDLSLPLKDVILSPATSQLAKLPEIETLRRSLIGQVVDLTALEALRRDMTEALVRAGYISSGVVLREIDLDRGTAAFALIEGQLTDVRVSGEDIHTDDTARPFGALAAGYVSARIPRPEGAFNLIGTEEALRVLLRDRNIGRVDAAIRPGSEPGDTILDLNVTAKRNYDLSLTLANDTPDSIGEETARLNIAARNLVASGDELRAEFELTEGRRRINVEGDIPIWPGGPAPFLAAEYAVSDFVQRPGNIDEFSTSFLRFGAGVRVPLIETSREQLTSIIALDWKRTQSRFIGGGFAFSPGVEEDGSSQTAVFSIAQEYVNLAENSTLAVRGAVNIGLPILGATQNGAGVPDGEFVSVVAQAQAALRLAPELTMIARLQGQWASGALLPVEQVAIGGRETVRGFGEASISGDRALVGALEARVAAFDLAIPGFTPPDHDATLVVAPFIDGGAVRRLFDKTDDLLIGAGAGLIWSPRPGLAMRGYYGFALEGPEIGTGIQGEGFHFAVSIALP